VKQVRASLQNPLGEQDPVVGADREAIVVEIVFGVVKRAATLAVAVTCFSRTRGSCGTNLRMRKAISNGYAAASKVD
jgi:hypothetical protein